METKSIFTRFQRGEIFSEDGWRGVGEAFKEAGEKEARPQDEETNGPTEGFIS